MTIFYPKSPIYIKISKSQIYLILFIWKKQKKILFMQLTKKFLVLKKRLSFPYFWMKSSFSPITPTLYNTFTEGPETIPFDVVMEAVGFGNYQLRIYLIMCLMAFSEGAHIMSFTLMLPILKVQWLVSDSLNGFQASMIFLAYLLGSVSSGQISDKSVEKFLVFTR